MNYSYLSEETPADLICLSHLRWGFVFQRPQHLMSRFAKSRRVFFVEEPVFEGTGTPHMLSTLCANTGVNVVVPTFPVSARDTDVCAEVRSLMKAFMEAEKIQQYIAWFYTPMALDYCYGLKPLATIYDCMDELSLFQNAPARLHENEVRLFALADLVFTGGVSLFEVKRKQHARVYPFPSSVDVAHFGKARRLADSEEDQKDLPHPRLGYAGVIDERMNLELIRDMAAQRPGWQFIMIGPVVKIDPATLPQAPNIHWLGMKDYQTLPAYFSGWDVALLPFALNNSTRFISPTKTPEYLAAGLPVISTAIRDVVRPYGDLGLARIASTAAQFIEGAEHAMAYGMSLKWRGRADSFLATLSWDKTWNAMNKLIEDVIDARRCVAAAATAGLPKLLRTDGSDAPRKSPLPAAQTMAAAAGAISKAN